MFDLAKWCRDTAADYRNHEPHMFSHHGDVRGICGVIRTWFNEQLIPFEDPDAQWAKFMPLFDAIEAMPQCKYATEGYKWARSEEGCDERADFLEEFAQKLTDN